MHSHKIHTTTVSNTLSSVASHSIYSCQRIWKEKQKITWSDIVSNKSMIRWYYIRDHPFRTLVIFHNFLPPPPSWPSVVFFYYPSANLAKLVVCLLQQFTFIFPWNFNIKFAILSNLIGGCFIYILDSSNSSSITFWTSQFGSSSRGNWTGIWTGNSNGSWTDKQSSHISRAKEMSVKAIFFFM